MRFKLKLIYIIISVHVLYAFNISDIDTDIENIIDFYEEHPVNLNSAKEEDIYKLPYLTLSDCKNIVNIRKKYGSFNPVDLISYNIVDYDIYAQIKDCFYQEKFKNRSLFITEVKRDYPEEKGFTDSTFLGSPYEIRNSLKLKLSEKNYKILLKGKIQKKEGEVELGNNNSFYVNIKHQYFNINIGRFNYYSPSKLFLYEKSYITDDFSNNFLFSKVFSGSVSRSFGHTGLASQLFYSNYSFISVYGRKDFSASLDDNGNITHCKSEMEYRSYSEWSQKENTREELWGNGIEYSNNIKAFIFWYNKNYNRGFAEKEVFRGNIFEGGVKYPLVKNTFSEIFIAGSKTFNLKSKIFYKHKKNITALFYTYINEAKLDPFSPVLFENSDAENENQLRLFHRNSLKKFFLILILNFISQKPEMNTSKEINLQEKLL